MEKINVAVLLGGESVERDISLITGFQVFKALDENKYNKCIIYIDENNKWWKCREGIEKVGQLKTCSKDEVTLKSGESNLYLIKGKKLKLDVPLHCCVLALHGGLGENGAVQGFLDLCQIAYTSSGSISSALTMDKCVTKQILKGNALPTLPFVCLKNYEYYENEAKNIAKIANKLRFPLIIKPACLGSSIGIKIAHNKSELKDAINFAFKFGNKLLIETALTNFTELNVSARCQNGKVLLSLIEKPHKSAEFLSFDDKYKSNAKIKLGGVKSGGTKGMASLKREFPAQICEKTESELIALTKRIYNLFDCFGIVRLDYLVRSDGKIFLNEINSIPGSLSFYLWGKEQFGSVLNDEIEGAIKRKLLNDGLIKKFDSLLF